MQTQTIVTLAELFEELDRHEARVPLDVLKDRMARLTIDWAEIEPFVKYSADTYRRNLMRAGPSYHALILCWKNGQRSPIHDHAGSSCGVRVLKGTCTETVFDRTPDNYIYPTETRKLGAGFCCGSEDADIHQISNIGPGLGELITLHIYSPPLLKMGQYSLTTRTRDEFTDEVFSFVEGAGI